MYIPALKTKYKEEIVPALMKEFGYKSIMQVPKLQKIVINQGVGQAIADKKLLEYGVKELSDIAGQKAVQTMSTKDISNFKLRKNMPIGIMVTLRTEKMYEFLERLISVALPRIRDFKGSIDGTHSTGAFPRVGRPVLRGRNPVTPAFAPPPGAVREKSPHCATSGQFYAILSGCTLAVANETAAVGDAVFALPVDVACLGRKLKYYSTLDSLC